MDDATYGLGHLTTNITPRRAQRPTAPRFLPTAGEAASDDPSPQPGAPSSAPSELRFTKRVSLRTETRGVSLLVAIRRIVSAITVACPSPFAAGIARAQ